MYVHHVMCPVSAEIRRGSQIPETRVLDSEPPFSEPNLGPLKEQALFNC